MFDLLKSFGEKRRLLDAVNRRGLTPFTLAATLARNKVRLTAVSRVSCLFVVLSGRVGLL